MNHGLIAGSQYTGLVTPKRFVNVLIILYKLIFEVLARVGHLFCIKLSEGSLPRLHVTINCFRCIKVKQN